MPDGLDARIERMAKPARAIAKGIAKAKSAASRKASKTVDSASDAVARAEGPSPNPMTNLVLADVALRGGGQLLRHAVERALLGAKYTPEKAKNIIKGRSMAQTLVGTAIARIATRSVPGAIIIGGGLLAKTLYDRQKDRQVARLEGKKDVEEQAGKGAKA